GHRPQPWTARPRSDADWRSRPRKAYGRRTPYREGLPNGRARRICDHRCLVAARRRRRAARSFHLSARSGGKHAGSVMATLDLSLPPEDAPRLSRSRALSGLKSGHARSTPARIIWHDSPDGSLAADGVSLAETRNVWRMERLYPTIARPDVAAWPPAAPPP